MKRAILVALLTGAVITSAAAISVGTASTPVRQAAATNEYERARAHAAARELQREQVVARYRVARAQCDSLGGLKRDNCLVSAHALKGHALLEIQDPYSRS